MSLSALSGSPAAASQLNSAGNASSSTGDTTSITTAPDGTVTTTVTAPNGTIVSVTITKPATQNATSTGHSLTNANALLDINV